MVTGLIIIDMLKIKSQALELEERYIRYIS
jgi:hypothetical protein